MGQAREGARHQGGVGRIARFVVPFGADGAADRAARAFAHAFARGGDVAIENVPGEGGLAGVRRANALVAEAREPVLLLGTPSTHILLPARLGPSAVPEAAFSMLIGLGSAPNVLLASPRLDVKSVEDLVARARDVELVYASAGTGQTIDVCTAYLCALAGIRMTHRPYDAGSASAYGDLVAGRVHVYFDNLLGCREAIDRGDAVPLAISAARRNRLLPAVPTLAECGFPEHALDIWFGVFGAGIGAPRWREFQSSLADPSLAMALEAAGLSDTLRSADDLEVEIAKSSGEWKRALAATTAIRTLVLVEGDSDAAAVRALAGLIGCDLGAHRIQIWSAAGVTNFSRVLADFVRAYPSARFCGMYDVADERHVRRALVDAAIPIADHESLESFGFFACVADLEDELIRALGAEAVERVLEAQAELTPFRSFQAMPQHRGEPLHRQLRRFMGTRATRKIRCAQRFVEALDLARLPYPLAQLAARLVEDG